MLQRTQSEFYIRILHEHRAVPTYFRVGFYGAAFPAFLQVLLTEQSWFLCNDPFLWPSDVMKTWSFWLPSTRVNLWHHRVCCWTAGWKIVVSLCLRTRSLYTAVMITRSWKHFVSVCRRNLQPCLSWARTRRRTTPSKQQMLNVSLSTYSMLYL